MHKIIITLLISFSIVNSNFVRAEDKKIDLNFHAEINGQVFKCGESYAGVGKSQSEITPTDFRMYISEVAFLNEQGKWIKANLVDDGIWQNQSVAMLDFENGLGPCRNGTSATNSVIKVIVPDQQYSGLKFVIGVPFPLNHADPTVAKAPLSSTALFWSWQSGYRFIKFDARVKSANVGLGGDEHHAKLHNAHQSHQNSNLSAVGYSMHLGSTECAASSSTAIPKQCKNPNRVAVEIKPFNVEKNSLVIDIGRVLKQTDISINTPQTSPGCMSFPGDADCVSIMDNLGIPYDGKSPSGIQKLIFAR